MNKKDFKVGELVIYTANDEQNISCELGVIKSLLDDGAFVYYHSGSTAAKTSYDNLHKLINANMVKEHLINSLD